MCKRMGLLNEAKLQQFADIAWLHCYQWLKKILYHIDLFHEFRYLFRTFK